MLMKEFAGKIRAKYPGVYDSMDDKDLVDKVLIKHPQYGQQIQDPSYFMPPQAADWFPAGAEVPVEQRLAENTVKVGNAAGLAFGLPGIVKGIAGLGMRAVGAIGEGLAPAAESAAPWFGSRVLGFARSTLPADAIKAGDVVDSATDYAMKPHPEIQQAIMDIKGMKGAAPAAEDAASAGTDMVPASESTVKVPQTALESGTKELPPGNPELQGSQEIGPKGGDNEGPVLEGEVQPEAGAETPAEEPEIENMEHLNEPIITPTGSTKDMLVATDKHLKTVGGAIDDTLTKLNETGQQFDPAPVAKKLEQMYIKDASGKIIPAGADSEQAVNNAAVSHALATLKAEAQSADGTLTKLPWERANAIKGSLQQLADQSPVYEQAGRAVKEAIDDQAQQAMASNGGNVQAFQALRNAYSNLKNVRRALNNNALGQMSAKNAVPVVRTLAAGGGIATGNPGVAAVAGADYVGRRFGSQMMAAGLRNMPEAAEGVSDAGRAMTAGQGLPAARSIANGLMATEDDN